jgi:hypothetical protein
MLPFGRGQTARPRTLFAEYTSLSSVVLAMFPLRVLPPSPPPPLDSKQNHFADSAEHGMGSELEEL